MNGSWSRLDIAGKPADLYALEGGLRPRFVLLFLHPYGLETLAGDDAYTSLFDELRVACLCPHAGRCWWADRACSEFDPALTPERHLLDNILPFLRDRLGIAPPGV